MRISPYDIRNSGDVGIVDRGLSCLAEILSHYENIP